MIALNLDVTKIPRTRIKTNPKWKGKFLDLVLIEKKDEKWDGFVSISVSKEERANGVRGEIIGNWKHLCARQTEPVKPRPDRPPVNEHDGEDIPF